MNPFSEKVAATLAFKGLEFERVVSDKPEDVARWSPIARTLPVLEIDGRRKAESAAILEWLEGLYPTPSLFAGEPKTAEAQRHLAEWSDDSFAWYWNRWRAARYPQPGDSEPVDDRFFARLREQLSRRFGGTPKTRASLRELEIIREVVARMSDLVGFLGVRPFFYADEPSIADISIYSMLRVLREGPIPHCAEAIEARPTLAAFLDRVDGRVKSVEMASEATES
jgi:glutathione S-transferase